MSDKMKVGQVVNEAVRFGRYRWGAVIRFGWLPAIVSCLLFVAYAAFVINFETAQAMANEEISFELASFFRAPLPVVIALGLVVYSIMILLFSGVYASIFRLVAMGEERPGIFHLRMDGPAVRVFLAYLILTIIGFVIWIISIGVGFVITGKNAFSLFPLIGQVIGEFVAVGETYEPSKQLLTQLGEAVEPYGLGILLGLIPMVYILIKLFPFPAASAVEDRLVLLGSFRMTFGHWWTIFFSVLLMVVFLSIAVMIFELTSSILELIFEYALAQGGTLTALGAILGFGLLVVSIVFNAFIYAVQFSMHAIVYRRLTTGE